MMLAIKKRYKIIRFIVPYLLCNYRTLFLLGLIYCKLKDYNKALSYQLKIIDFFPDYYGGYNSVGNTYRVLKDYSKAFDYVYKSLELNPKSEFATGTLAEIYAELGNENEFYKNLQLSFIFGMNSGFDPNEQVSEEEFEKERKIKMGAAIKAITSHEERLELYIIVDFSFKVTFRISKMKPQ